MRKLMTLVLGLAMAASGALAHEGHDHGESGTKVMGTVTAVHKEMNHVELKDKDGKVVGFTVGDKTKYLRGKATAAFVDVKVGDRVVVSLSGEGDKRQATEIRLSDSKPKADAAVEDQKGHTQHKH